MATTDWLGTANDGDWANAANWSGIVPVNGDIARFLTGSKSVVTGLNQAAVDLAQLIIGSGYTGDIGLSGTPLQIDCGQIYINGGGAIYLDDGAGPSVDNIMINNTSTTGVSLKGVLGTVRVNKGVVDFAGTGVISSLYCAYLTNQTTDAVITFSAAATVNALHVLGGSVTIPDALAVVLATSIEISGGTLSLGTSTDITAPPAYTQTGGTCIVNMNPTGTIASWVIEGGTLDASQSQIAKVFDKIETYGSAVARLNNGARNVTATNGVIVYGGTSPIVDRGIKLVLSVP